MDRSESLRQSGLTPVSSILSLLAFAQVLRERRKALGLTQQDLEEDGVAQSYISKLELGKRQVCLRNFIHIVEMLETTPVELMDAVMKRLNR